MLDPRSGRALLLGFGPLRRAHSIAKTTTTKTAPKARKAPKGKLAQPVIGKGGTTARPGSKLETIINMMKAKGGTTLAAVAKATEWTPAAVRGVIYNAVKGRLGLTVKMTPDEGGTVFTINGGIGHQAAATGK